MIELKFNKKTKENSKHFNFTPTGNPRRVRFFLHYKAQVTVRGSRPYRPTVRKELNGQVPRRLDGSGFQT